MAGLSSLRVQVQAGAGIVARHPDVLLVVPGYDLAQQAALDRLLELCTRYTGRTLARKVAGLLAAAEVEEVPPVALLTSVGEVVAVLVAGDVEVVVQGEDGTTERLDGSGCVTWLDRIVGSAVGFTVGVPGVGVSRVEPRSDLVDGVVQGGGALLVPAARDVESASVPAPRPPATPPSAPGSPEPAGPVFPGTAEASLPPAPGPGPDSAPVSGVQRVQPFQPIALLEPETRREPLPLAVPRPAEPTGVLVQGILCSEQHLNDPRALFCNACGRNLVHVTHAPAEGVRPPLGVLVLDDSSVVALDGNYLLGREPEYDERVLSGDLRPLRLDDDQDLVSRVHAELLLQGWDVVVVDRRSANGTWIGTQGSDDWQRIPAGVPTVLRPGNRLRVGSRALVFESPHHL